MKRGDTMWAILKAMKRYICNWIPAFEESETLFKLPKKGETESFSLKRVTHFEFLVVTYYFLLMCDSKRHANLTGRAGHTSPHRSCTFQENHSFINHLTDAAFGQRWNLWSLKFSAEKNLLLSTPKKVRSRDSQRIAPFRSFGSSAKRSSSILQFYCRISTVNFLLEQTYARNRPIKDVSK